MNGRVAIAFVAALHILAGSARADGLGTLIEVGGNMTEIAREYDAQTARFEQVRQALGRGAIAKGVSRDSVIARYGEPVIANTDTATGREKLVYMPATSDFFEGIKIYLYFAGGALDEIRVKK